MISVFTVKMGALFPSDGSSKRCKIFSNLHACFSASLHFSLLTSSRQLSGRGGLAVHGDQSISLQTSFHFPQEKRGERIKGHVNSLEPGQLSA